MKSKGQSAGDDLGPGGFRWIFRYFSMAPDETGLLESVEEARRENGGKGAKGPRPRLRTSFIKLAVPA